MAEVSAETSGMDRDFKFTASDDSIEYGEVSAGKAKELVRQLTVEGGVTHENLEDEDGVVWPPILHLSFKRKVKKGFLWKSEVEDLVTLNFSGGREVGSLDTFTFGDNNFPEGEVSLSQAERLIDDFFNLAAQEWGLSTG